MDKYKTAIRNNPVRLTKLASAVGCVCLLVAILGTSNKGTWFPSVIAWFIVAGSGVVGIVGYGLCKWDRLPIGVLYLIVPLLLLGGIVEILFFGDIIAMLVRVVAAAPQVAPRNAGIARCSDSCGWGTVSLG